jgi:excisionase family DNA binding protein
VTIVDERRLLTTAEAAALLRVSTRHLHRLVQAGTLRPIRLTPRGEFKFRASDLDELIDRGVAA